MLPKKSIVQTIALAVITTILVACSTTTKTIPVLDIPVVDVPDTVDVVDTIPPTEQTICKDEADGNPVITSLSVYTGSIKTDFEINGCNFSGFEGDKNAWIENDQGVKGVLYAKTGSTSKLIKVSLEASLCQTENSYSGLQCDDWLNLVPGTYKVYVMPWGKESNRMEFTITTTPVLSEDSKSIVTDGKTLLTIDNDVIFNFFKNESGLSFANKQEFISMTRFASIVVSPDKTKIGFTIESDALTPDKVVGFLNTKTPSANPTLLTNYYLGNDFLSFSPNGKSFVYQGSCWEGMCGLFINNSETLTEQLSLNNPEYLDLMTKDATFIRWISSNEVEYKLGTETKTASF